MRRTAGLRAIAALLLSAPWALPACSDPPAARPAPDRVGDAGVDAPTTAPDAGGEGGGGGGGGPPEPPPPPPQVVSSGGPVLAAPRVVPIFFAGEPLQSDLETFLAALAGSPYWAATTAEYGVGALAIAPSVVVAEAAPTAITDEEIRSWLAERTDGLHDGWPAADPETIFAVVYPKSTSIDVHGKKSCQAFDAYHLEGTAADGGALVYAVLSRCVGGAAALDEVTAAMSHELVEAATDPLYYSAPAFASADHDHAIWTAVTAGEVADMCAFDDHAYAPLVGDFVVQRSWSNAAALAGKDPCVPPVEGPFLAAAPVLDDDVVLTGGGAKIPTKGVQVPVGETRTIEVALLGDADEPGSIEADDASLFFGGAQQLAFTWDAQTGKSGDRLHLTIERLKPGPWGGSALVLRATIGTVERTWFGFVAN